MDRIIVEHRSIPGRKWRAECSVGGKTWVEVSRNGATHALARTLKESGYTDAQFAVHENGRPGFLLVPSFHAWAEWTYTGGGARKITWAQALADAERLKAMRDR